MNNKIIKMICTFTFICAISIGYGSLANAAEMENFPTQKKSAYSTQYTRGLQVMLLHYSSKASSQIQQGGGADGVYGTRTAQAVTIFQGAVGISKDGVCGPATWKKLKSNLVYKNSSGSYLYYNGKYSYDPNGKGKYNMRRNLANNKWQCYYAAWYTVG